MFYSFVDNYDRQLDDRGRIILPAKLREVVGTTVYITRSPSDKCLHLYTEEEWAVLSEKMRKLPVTIDKNAAAFVRMFFGRASSCEIDKQGRMSIGKALCEFAGIEKDVILVGANTRLEIWSRDAWEEYNKALSENVVLDGIERFGVII